MSFSTPTRAILRIVAQHSRSKFKAIIVPIALVPARPRHVRVGPSNPILLAGCANFGHRSKLSRHQQTTTILGRTSLQVGEIATHSAELVEIDFGRHLAEQTMSPLDCPTPQPSLDTSQRIPGNNCKHNYWTHEHHKAIYVRRRS